MRRALPKVRPRIAPCKSIRAVSRNPLKIALRLIPESWRIAASGRLPRTFRERLLAEQFRTATDWRKTTVFPIPALYTGFLRVNLRGREPDGIVEPGGQYRALLDRLEDDLRQLVDPEVNRPAVKKLARAVELFGDDPHVALPDLFVEWTPTRYIKRRVVHPRAVLVQENLDYERGSHHTHEGFFAASGPRIEERGNLGDVDVLGFAPTFLTLVDEPIPVQMSGKVIEEMIRD